jgi:hypothetical protein
MDTILLALVISSVAVILIYIVRNWIWRLWNNRLNKSIEEYASTYFIDNSSRIIMKMNKEIKNEIIVHAYKQYILRKQLELEEVLATERKEDYQKVIREYMNAKNYFEVKVKNDLIKYDLMKFDLFDSMHFLDRIISHLSAMVQVENLVVSIILKFINNVKITKGASTEKNTIVGVMLLNKSKVFAKAYIYLFISLLINIFVAIIFPVIGYLPLMVTLVALGLVYLNQHILEYRIKNGYFGNNEYEAREIIQFITEHRDKSDFTSGGKIKDLLPASEVEEIISTFPVKGLA